MKGIRFYEELANKNRAREGSRCSVVAVFYERGFGWGEDHFYECVAKVYEQSNPPVCNMSVNSRYLRADCRRISESRARVIHPRLFRYLEQLQGTE